MLTAKTTVYVTGRDATTKMAFLDLVNALKGGLDLKEVEITTDAEESQALDRKRIARQEVQHLMSSMTARQAERVVRLIRNDDELMEVHEGYS